MSPSLFLGPQQEIFPHLACLLDPLLRYIHRHVSRYAPLDVPCRRTQIRRNLVELFLTVTLKSIKSQIRHSNALLLGRKGTGDEHDGNCKPAGADPAGCQHCGKAGGRNCQAEIDGFYWAVWGCVEKVQTTSRSSILKKRVLPCSSFSHSSRE